jgi:hypothetical protein
VAETCHCLDRHSICLHRALCLLHPLPVLHHSRRSFSYYRDQSRLNNDCLPSGLSNRAAVVEYPEPGVRPQTCASIQLSALNGSCNRLRRFKIHST